jgi:hypothetical protein
MAFGFPQPLDLCLTKAIFSAAFRSKGLEEIRDSRGACSACSEEWLAVEVVADPMSALGRAATCD